MTWRRRDLPPSSNPSSSAEPAGALDWSGFGPISIDGANDAFPPAETHCAPCGGSGIPSRPLKSRTSLAVCLHRRTPRDNPTRYRVSLPVRFRTIVQTSLECRKKRLAQDGLLRSIEVITERTASLHQKPCIDLPRSHTRPADGFGE